MKIKLRFFAAPLALLWILWTSPVVSAQPQSAGRILDAAGVGGGLVVHIGCGDGQSDMEIATRGSYVVHRLESDAKSVAKARAEIEAKGLWGQVTVELWDYPYLPYADELVNLIVISGKCRVTIAELWRVLAPRGVVLFTESGSTELERQLATKLPAGRVEPGWRKYTKLWPGDIDEWTHYLYDAGNNAVSQDQRVGPPRHVRWKAGPRFARHHDLLASTSAMVSVQGRIFYITDDGPTTLMDYPPKWRLAARDAFNGVLLWKREIPTWAASRPFRTGPPQLARRLVSIGDRVYVTLGAGAPVSELDAATGNTLRTFPRTEGADEILLHDGVLLLVIGDDRRGGILDRAAVRSLLAVNVKSGDTLWRKSGDETKELWPATVAAAGKWVAYQCGDSVHCVELDTGRNIWDESFAGRGSEPAAKQDRPDMAKSRRKNIFRASFYAPTLVLSPEHNVVLSAAGGTLRAYDLETGEKLWDCPCTPDFHAPADVFLADGLVWSGLFAAEGRDPRSGEVKRKLNIDGLLTPGHHPRCYRNKATDRFIISNKRGLEFFDLRDGDHLRNDWVRGQCQYGIMPGNGLMYIPPNPCCCYPNALLHGFYALASATVSETPNVTERLERGPAFGKTSSRTNDDSAWPTYRGGETRSGSTDSKLPVDVQSLWKVALAGRLSSPVIADGMLLVSSIDQGRIVALDAGNGAQQWSFVAGGRVDTPPTVVDGLVVFGCSDGWVYCLDAADGALAWRFRAALRERRIMVDDRLESVWPVHAHVTQYLGRHLRPEQCRMPAVRR